MEFQILEYHYLQQFEDKIYVSQFDSDLRVELMDSIEGKEMASANQDLAGDIDMEFRLDRDVVGVELFARIEKEVLKHLSKIMNNDKFRLRNMWINYQKPTEYNPTHIHEGAFSFVWYIDIPEEIRQEHAHQHSNDTTQSRGLIQFISGHTSNVINLCPMTNDFLLFRANHMHHVYPFYSDNTRISVSGNIIIDE